MPALLPAHRLQQHSVALHSLPVFFYYCVRSFYGSGCMPIACRLLPLLEHAYWRAWQAHAAFVLYIMLAFVYVGGF